MTREHFAKLFFLLSKSKMIKAETDIMEAWYSLLKDYPDQQLEKAFMLMIRSNDSFPTVGKLIEIIENRNNTEAEANEIWYVILDSRKEGTQAYLDMGPITKNAIRAMGGWDEIKYAEVKDLMFHRSSIIKYIKSMLEDDYRKEDIKKLEGKEMKLLGE